MLVNELEPGVMRFRGFTIMELLVTLVIVGILASGMLPMAEIAYQRSKEQELKAALRTIRSAIDAYKKAADEGHIILKAGDSGYPKTLQSLVDGVVDAKDPKGGKLYFIRRIPPDPMLVADADVPTSKHWGLRSYASSAEDPREGVDVFDVYSRATGIGINRIPYRDW